MEFKNINIRNLYIDLLNRIKNVEGVDKDYVDGLIEVLEYHLTALDIDLAAIESVIPESASVSNPLVTEDDIPAHVNADWNATSGLAEILNKPIIPVVPTVINPVYSEFTVNSADWVNVSGVYHWGSTIAGVLLYNIPSFVFIRPLTQTVETAAEQAAFAQIVQTDITLDNIPTQSHIELIAGSSAPATNFKIGVISWKTA